MRNNFTCDWREIVMHEQGWHHFLTAVSMKSWLESIRPGIEYWQCSFFPFLKKYSTNECLKIIKDPSLMIKNLTHWLRVRISRATLTPTPTECAAHQGKDGDNAASDALAKKTAPRA